MDLLHEEQKAGKPLVENPETKRVIGVKVGNNQICTFVLTFFQIPMLRVSERNHENRLVPVVNATVPGQEAMIPTVKRNDGIVHEQLKRSLDGGEMRPVLVDQKKTGKAVTPPPPETIIGMDGSVVKRKNVLTPTEGAEKSGIRKRQHGLMTRSRAGQPKASSERE